MQGYRCCGLESFQFMSREQGGEYGKRSSADTDTDTDTETLQLRQKSVTEAIDLRMHLELQWGYAAAVSFVDAQLGRLLDVVDELELWSNLTIVLTSDHGMHLGACDFYSLRMRQTLSLSIVVGLFCLSSVIVMNLICLYISDVVGEKGVWYVCVFLFL